MGGSGSGVALSGADRDMGLNVLTKALEGLTAQEREVLGGALDEVLLELRTGLVQRLESL